MKRRSREMYVLETQEEDDVISAQLCAFLMSIISNGLWETDAGKKYTI